MKSKFIFLICLVSLSFLACDRENLLEANNNKENNAVPESYVSEGMVLDMLERNMKNTKSSSPSYTVEAYTDSNLDTLMYIVRYGDNNGWQILSSDTRTPAILAESKTGSFSLEDGSPGFRIWIACMAHDIKMVRNSSDDQLSFSADEIAANKAFWSSRPTRQQSPPEINIGGSWFVSTQSETIVVDTVDHMVPKWDQDSPYNNYCPYQLGSDTLKAPVGCVAVAGSQVLKFLHDTLGIPSAIPSHCFISGDIQFFNRVFYNSTSTVWNSISYDYLEEPTDSVAVLLSYVGYLANMNYRNSYSWALPANLRTGVFNYFGIDCSHGSYNENTVQTSLDNHMPVIVTATDLLIPVDGDIHCFVIDGYKRTYTKYTHHHYWVPDEPGLLPDPDLYSDYYTYSYSSPAITAIKINWGWWSQWMTGYLYNDNWYTLTGNWVTTHPNSTSQESWNYNREMIYGFNVQE